MSINFKLDIFSTKPFTRPTGWTPLTDITDNWTNGRLSLRLSVTHSTHSKNVP